MAASKQILDTPLSGGRDLLESPSDSIETIFSSISKSPRREETRATLPRGDQSAEAKGAVHQYSLRFERRAEFQKKSKLVKNDSQLKSENISTILSKEGTDAAETLHEEDWVRSEFPR